LHPYPTSIYLINQDEFLCLPPIAS
jgi:hypothetical protein